MIASFTLLIMMPGHFEILLIVLALLLLFGGKKIPEMMRGLGSGVKEFKKGLREEDTSKKSLPEDEKAKEGEK